MTQGKHCTKCGVWKVFDDYHRHPMMRDGRASQCKACRKLYTASIAEVARKRAHDWVETNRERRRAYDRRYKRRLRAGLSTRRQRRYHRDRDLVNRKRRSWYARHRERIVEARRARRQQA